jgi:uncharacterized membrane protein YeaQ/YmgE (transglycosylase-associated protein family)
MGVVVWIAAGLAMGAVARAVSAESQSPGLLVTLGLGAVGGLAGGAAISTLAQRTVAGFTAGFIGSLLGACVLLAVGGVLAAPRRRVV